MRWMLLLAVLLLASGARAEIPMPRPPGDAVAEALSCLREAESPAAALDCAQALAARPDWRTAATCLLRGEGPEPCLGLRQGALLLACAKAAGWSAESATACLGLTLASVEALKCLEAGIGSPGGCFGPSNTLRRWGEAGWGQARAWTGW